MYYIISEMTDKSVTIILRMSPEQAAEIEEWRAQQRPIPSRSGAVRTLINAGLRESETSPPIQKRRKV